MVKSWKWKLQSDDVDDGGGGDNDNTNYDCDVDDIREGDCVDYDDHDEVVNCYVDYDNLPYDGDDKDDDFDAENNAMRMLVMMVQLSPLY